MCLLLVEVQLKRMYQSVLCLVEQLMLRIILVSAYTVDLDTVDEKVSHTHIYFMAAYGNWQTFYSCV